MTKSAPCDPALARPPARPLRVLVLGGTAEARALARRIGADPRLDGVVSLAGRTGEPLPQDLPARIGGFGGVEGLVRFLSDNAIDKVVDATHPFAARISANAQAACARLDLPLVAYARAPWTPVAGDRWTCVANNAEAAQALGEEPRRVFLAIGRLGVADFRAAPQHDYLLRVIDPAPPEDLPPRCETIRARGPFDLTGETALLRERRIEVLVSKNSGGPATYAKIEAARRLGIAVAMVAPPPADGAAVVRDLDAVMAFLAPGGAP
jgi:precorrin-6A/cobalt-precorrin-6A reductase